MTDGRTTTDRVPAGTLPMRRIDYSPDGTILGAVYRAEWAPRQDGEAGHWRVCSPVGDIGRLSAHHTVTEHNDGTITVEPSLCFDGPGRSGWHGYLKGGVWEWWAFTDLRYHQDVSNV